MLAAQARIYGYPRHTDLLKGTHHAIGQSSAKQNCGHGTSCPRARCRLLPVVHGQGRKSRSERQFCERAGLQRFWLPWRQCVAPYFMVTRSAWNEEHRVDRPRPRCAHWGPGMDALERRQHRAVGHIDRKRGVRKCHANASRRHRDADRLWKLDVRRALPACRGISSLRLHRFRAFRRQHRRQTGFESRACRLSDARQYHCAGEICCEVSPHITVRHGICQKSRHFGRQTANTRFPPNDSHGNRRGFFSPLGWSLLSPTLSRMQRKWAASRR